MCNNVRNYSKTCVRQPPLKLTFVVDVERWVSYKDTCHVILLAKLHDMYLYKTDNFFHINHYLRSISKVALLHRFYCSVPRSLNDDDDTMLNDDDKMLNMTCCIV